MAIDKTELSLLCGLVSNEPWMVPELENGATLKPFHEDLKYQEVKISSPNTFCLIHTKEAWE